MFVYLKKNKYFIFALWTRRFEVTSTLTYTDKHTGGTKSVRVNYVSTNQKLCTFSGFPKLEYNLPLHGNLMISDCRCHWTYVIPEALTPCHTQRIGFTMYNCRLYENRYIEFIQMNVSNWCFYKLNNYHFELYLNND